MKSMSSRRFAQAVISLILLTVAASAAGCARLEAFLKIEPTPAKTETPVPTAPLPTRDASTLTPTGTPVHCADSFYFVRDLTIPDGTVLTPGTAFTKKWEIRNNSGCKWNPEYKLRFISGENFGSPASLPFPNANSGENVVLALDLTAPEEAGMYEGNWKIFSDNNLSFGTILTVQIYVY